MSKKLLIYGLAFGSATAALGFVYMTSVVFSQSLWTHLFFIFSEFIIIPGLGIYLFLRAVRTQSPTEFLMGRAVFTGFFLSIIISASVSLLFSYLVQFRPEIIGRMVDLKISLLMKNKDASGWTPKELENNIKSIRESYTAGSQFIFQLFLGGARGLFLSAILAYFMKAKMNKDNSGAIEDFR